MPELAQAEDGQKHTPAALISAALLHNKLPVEDGFFHFDVASFLLFSTIRSERVNFPVFDSRFAFFVWCCHGGA